MEERERLRVILEHWIRHNEAHFEEYRRWASVAASLGLEVIKEKIEEATGRIEEANELFREALKAL
ncbi:MAG: hypothetical protein DRG33_03165 [Deltaproteobacteria bacterium]|nr:MAG: hypothetical protein DRG33_03165 [Deltaproteobacteria bacterium]HEX16774.1 hypothetical protein [Deltaproteobacteria bacterium]